MKDWKLPSNTQVQLQRLVDGLFMDNEVWPASTSKYYPGRLPRMAFLDTDKYRMSALKLLASRCDDMVGRIAGARRRNRTELGKSTDFHTGIENCLVGNFRVAHGKFKVAHEGRGVRIQEC